MAPSGDDKGKRPREEDHQDLKLKEEQVAGGSRARNPTFVGSMNAGRAFSHNMQGPTCDDLKFDNKFEVPVMYSTAIPGSCLRYT
jgi:hypothetical protein